MSAFGGYVILRPDTDPEDINNIDGYAVYGDNSTSEDYEPFSAPWDRDTGKCHYGRRLWSDSSEYENLWELDRMRQTHLGSMIADFYLLDGIAANVAVPNSAGITPTFDARLIVDMVDAGFFIRNRDSLEGVIFEAAVSMSRHLTESAEIVRKYLHYAVAGELCFHPAMWDLGTSWPDCITSWWYLNELYGGARTSAWAVELFDPASNSWDCSYGGSAWMEIAKVLHWYESGVCEGMPFGPREFLDRAFTLQHNTNSVFDKTSWKGGITVKSILDAHASSNWAKLYSEASTNARGIAQEYTYRALQDTPTASNPFPFDMLDYKPEPEPEPEPEKVKYHPVTAGYKCQKVMDAIYPGKCKVSGESFPEGSAIVWHGKGKGASLKSAWEAKYGPAKG